MQVSALLVEEVLNMLRQDAQMASSRPLTKIAIKEPKDIPILSSAINGNGDVFITGDKEILALPKVGTLRILSPREFWETVKRGLQQAGGDTVPDVAQP